MPVSSLADLTDAQKQELVASLSAIVVGSSGVEVTAEALNAVAAASGNSLSEAWASVFAGVVAKVCFRVYVKHCWIFDCDCRANSILFMLSPEWRN
jgi:uncharacterized protein (DUF697 family)